MKKSKLKTLSFDVLRIFRNSISCFGLNHPIQLAGTTAYFAIFSTVPIIIIIISVFGFITGNLSIREKLFTQLEEMVGMDGAELLNNAIDNYRIVENSTLGTILGAIIFLISATALFSELQNSINYIWRIKVKSSFKISIFNLLKTRLFSFAVILGLGILLIASIMLDASFGIIKDFLKTRLNPDFVILAQTMNIILSMGVVAVATAFIYRFMPDIHVEWSAAWFGAGITSVFFATGRLLIGMFLNRLGMGIIYGTAGSIVIIMVFAYIIAFIFYFGVELTRQFSLYYGHNNLPRNYAGSFEIHAVE